MFTCKSGAQVPRAKVCNFVSDCADGSDEIACGMYHTLLISSYNITTQQTLVADRMYH